MKFKIEYSSKASKVLMFGLYWFGSFILDFMIAFIINLVTLLPNLVLITQLCSVIYKVENVPQEISIKYICAFYAIQCIIIAVVEIKRRFLYVKVEPDGIFVYTNLFMKFEYGKWYRRNVKLRYYDIECCYKCNGYFLPKTHISEYWFVKAFRRIENAVYSVQEREYKTAIAFGRYNADCIFLDLKNGKTAVLPIKDCDTFLAEYEKYAQRYM